MPTDLPLPGFFLILGGWGCPPPLRGRVGPKLAQMDGAAGKFLDRFDTNTEEIHEKCLPSAGPPLKRSLTPYLVPSLPRHTVGTNVPYA